MNTPGSMCAAIPFKVYGIDLDNIASSLNSHDARSGITSGQIGNKFIEVHRSELFQLTLSFSYKCPKLYTDSMFSLTDD